MNPEEMDEKKLLTEILKWIKFAGTKEVKGVLASELDSNQKKLVYQLSDGSKTIADINKNTGVSVGSISSYWQKWVKLALGEKIAVKGGERFKRSFDLEDLGIEVPEATPRTVPEDKKKELTEQKLEVIK